MTRRSEASDRNSRRYTILGSENVHPSSPIGPTYPALPPLASAQNVVPSAVGEGPVPQRGFGYSTPATFSSLCCAAPNKVGRGLQRA